MENLNEAIDYLKMSLQTSEKIAESYALPPKYCGTESLKIAIDAVEKQIAKKPDPVEGNAGSWEKYWNCPKCNGIVGIMGIKDSYCCHCGQKLDWEE